MEPFDELFRGKKADGEKLSAFGFVRQGESYVLTREIMAGDFRLTVTVHPRGTVETDVTDTAMNEPYALYRTSAEGSYVGRVREAVEDVLRDVAGRCFVSNAFRFRQTEALLAMAQKALGSAPEFLWEDTPDCAVLRRAETGKWYAVIMTVPRDRFGLPSHEKAEVVNLHAAPECIPSLLERPGYYPGWHMNKKHWYSVILDDAVPDEELEKRLRESYQLAKK